MKERVLFIYPPIDDNYYTVGMNDSPPLGLVVLHNVLKDIFGESVNIDIIDGEHCAIEKISRMIADNTYDLVGIQPMMSSYRNTLALLKEAKKNRATTVLGGHHATHLADAIMKNRSEIVDFVIAGDGEKAIVGLVNEDPLATIPNLVYYDSIKSTIIKTHQENSPIDNGKVLSFPPDLLVQYRNREDYERKSEISFRTYSHKGCSNRNNSQYCYFCGRADKGLRFKRPKLYVEELYCLSNDYNAKYVFEIGDDFLQDIFWAQEVANEYERKFGTNSTLSLKIFARANRISREAIEIMKRLNIDEVAIGFESGSRRILANIDKRITPEQNLDAAKMLFENKIDTIASFVLGLPGEDDESLKQTYEQAIAIADLSEKHLGTRPHEVIANLIEVSPGSPAFRKLQRSYPHKYTNTDLLSVRETQSDLFRVDFGFCNDSQLFEFRAKLADWSKKINAIGKYTYPAGWLKDDFC